MKEIKQNNTMPKQFVIAQLAQSSNEEIMKLYEAKIISEDDLANILYTKIVPQYNWKTTKYEVQNLTDSLKELEPVFTY